MFWEMISWGQLSSTWVICTDKLAQHVQCGLWETAIFSSLYWEPQTLGWWGKLPCPVASGSCGIFLIPCVDALTHGNWTPAPRYQSPRGRKDKLMSVE